MPKTKTPAKLTITVATRQARRHVDKLMPGVLATVETRGSADPITLAPLMVTTVTFPAGHENRMALGVALETLPGVVKMIADSARLVITREV